MSSSAEHYLSCYLSPPGERAVLSLRHDQSVVLWRRTTTAVELVRVWELERISGQKHHFWPLYSAERVEALLSALLATEGLTLADIRHCWGTPGLPAATDIALPSGAEEFPVHSLAHLFSGLLLDSRLFREATIIGLAVDGAPDFVLESEPKPYWYAGCVSRRGELTFAPVESGGPFYTAGETAFDKEPGTLMALASACTTDIDFDAEAAVARIEVLGGRMSPILVVAPVARSIVDSARRQLAGRSLDPRFSPEEHLQSAVMKVLQRCAELVTIRSVQRLCELGGVRPEECYLSMTGGFALNCPTNTMLLDRFGFKGLLTPPCANDSGQALGLGLLGLYGAGIVPRTPLRIETAYHGAELLDEDAALAEFAPWVEEVDDFAPARFVEDVTDDVVAWVDGAAEIGPRALGHRSLLGDPRSRKVKDLLNEVKGRQWWRPVAPVVLDGYSCRWFAVARPSPYMLEAPQVLADARDVVPAVVHLDGTARHQTLERLANPLLYEAIDAFRESTGVPMLCNTSLNDKGEPVVDTVAQALTFCLRKGIAVAYISGRRVRLTTQSERPLTGLDRPRARRLEFFAGQEDLRDELWRRWRERGFTEAAMLLLSRSPNLAAGPDGVAQVNQLAEHLCRHDGFRALVDRFRTLHGPGAAFTEGNAHLPVRWQGIGE